MALYFLKKYDEAIAHLFKATDLNPYFSLAYDNIGKCYSKLKMFKEAVQAHQQAIQINPYFYRAHFHKKNVQEEISKISEN